MKAYAIIDRLSVLLENVEDGNFSGDSITELCQQLQEHPDLKEYKLTRDDVLIVTQVWLRNFKNKNIDNGLEILSRFYPSTDLQINHLDKIISLLMKNVLHASLQKYNIERELSTNKLKAILKKSDIIDSDIDLHPEIMGIILGEKKVNNTDTRQPYKSNRELLDDWFSYVARIKELKVDRGSCFFDIGGLDEDEFEKVMLIEKLQEQINQRMAITTQKFPLTELISEHNLNHNETCILIYLLKEELEDNCSEQEEVIKLISNDHHELFTSKKI